MSQPNQVSPTPSEHGTPITTNSTTLVQPGPAIFDGFNTVVAGATSTITVYDNTTATGTPVFVGTANTVGYTPAGPGDGILMGTGICIVQAGGTAGTIIPLYSRYIP
jgi:hypothetical protein